MTDSSSSPTGPTQDEIDYPGLTIDTDPVFETARLDEEKVVLNQLLKEDVVLKFEGGDRYEPIIWWVVPVMYDLDYNVELYEIVPEHDGGGPGETNERNYVLSALDVYDTYELVEWEDVPQSIRKTVHQRVE